MGTKNNNKRSSPSNGSLLSSEEQHHHHQQQQRSCEEYPDDEHDSCDEQEQEEVEYYTFSRSRSTRTRTTRTRSSTTPSRSDDDYYHDDNDDSCGGENQQLPLASTTTSSSSSSAARQDEEVLDRTSRRAAEGGPSPPPRHGGDDDGDVNCRHSSSSDSTTTINKNGPGRMLVIMLVLVLPFLLMILAFMMSLRNSDDDIVQHTTSSSTNTMKKKNENRSSSSSSSGVVRLPTAFGILVCPTSTDFITTDTSSSSSSSRSTYDILGGIGGGSWMMDDKNRSTTTTPSRSNRSNAPVVHFYCKNSNNNNNRQNSTTIHHDHDQQHSSWWYNLFPRNHIVATMDRYIVHRYRYGDGQCIQQCLTKWKIQYTSFVFGLDWICGICPPMDQVRMEDITLVPPSRSITSTNSAYTGGRNITRIRKNNGSSSSSSSYYYTNYLNHNQPPIISTISGYSWDNQSWKSKYFELPIYSTLDRDTDDYWNYVVDELLLSRIGLVLLHGRGCWVGNEYNADSNEDNNANTTTMTSTTTEMDSFVEMINNNTQNKRKNNNNTNTTIPSLTYSNVRLMGTGNMCPRLLSRFVDAVHRARATHVIRVGMWDDTMAYQSARNVIEGRNSNDTELFDLANENNWKYFWDYNVKIWFDTIPSKLWFLLDNERPVISIYTLPNIWFTNQKGNASRMLRWLRDQFVLRYNIEPAFILHRSWMDSDPTITPDLATGQHSWFNPLKQSYTYTFYNGVYWGAAVPGYRDKFTQPGCGKSCREVPRLNGATLDRALHDGLRAKLVMLEGWTDMVESAGFYRSMQWDYPCQYINIVRRYADPTPETLLLQAEGADAFYDTTPENHGGAYANRSLDVGSLPDSSGWYVGWIDDGEWIEYQNVLLGCGVYRFSARLATTKNQTSLRIALNDVSSVVLPNTNGNYQFVLLGQTKLFHGSYNLRIVFEQSRGDGINFDYFFVKRVWSCRTNGFFDWLPPWLRL